MKLIREKIQNWLLFVLLFLGCLIFFNWPYFPASGKEGPVNSPLYMFLFWGTCIIFAGFVSGTRLEIAPRKPESSRPS